MDIIFSLSSSHDWILMHKGNGNQLREHNDEGQSDLVDFWVYSDVVLFRIKKRSRTLLKGAEGSVSVPPGISQFVYLKH